MYLLVNSPSISSPFISHHNNLTTPTLVGAKQLSRSSSSFPLNLRAKLNKNNNGVCVRAFIFDPTQERILKEAIKEPVAFLGGVFAGLLRLDLNEDPLKEWVAKTAEAAGIAQELDSDDVLQKETPQEIEIE